jgi:predicted phosphoribosyltransferase
MLKYEADGVLYLTVPEFFYYVGQFYAKFEQIDDSEAVRLLSTYWHKYDLHR